MDLTFRPQNIVEISTDITQSLKNIDFRRLHNLAKHAIYLKEASDATLLMIDSILDLHDGTKFPQTHRSLKYTRGLFQSVNLSLVSEGKNIDNTINLAFNLVSQRDSRQAREDSVIMKQDSTNMRLMSMVAMVYLPGTAVAVGL